MDKKDKAKQVVEYPSRLLKPVADLLKNQIKHLEKSKKRIEKDDPFRDVDRTTDNAAPDADAEEQFGHARNTAIKEQIDRKIIQSRKALTKIKIGSYGVCEGCKNMINTDRLMIYPEATFCVKCEAKNEKK